MRTDTSDVRLSISLGESGDGVIAGTHYKAPSGGSTLQICIHGNTYDQRYWDAGTVNGEDYSYARFMTAHGHDVLTIDLPGVGESSAFAGDDVPLTAVSRELARVVKDYRSGLGGSFDRVVLVGHSLGAVVATHVQSHFHAADALVVTGCSGLPMVRASFPSAVQSNLLREPHLRLPPDLRAKTFYYWPSADPDMISYDNQTLSTSMPRRMYADCVAARQNLEVLRPFDVTGSVYVQLGDKDPIANASEADAELSCWPSAESIIVECIQDIGHCFNLHVNRESSWLAIDRFLAGPA